MYTVLVSPVAGASEVRSATARTPAEMLRKHSVLQRQQSTSLAGGWKQVGWGSVGEEAQPTSQLVSHHPPVQVHA